MDALALPRSTIGPAMVLDQARAIALELGDEDYIQRKGSSGFSDETIRFVIRQLITLHEKTLTELQSFLLMHEREIATVTAGFETLYTLRGVFFDVIGREAKES